MPEATDASLRRSKEKGQAHACRFPTRVAASYFMIGATLGYKIPALLDALLNALTQECLLEPSHRRERSMRLRSDQGDTLAFVMCNADEPPQANRWISRDLQPNPVGRRSGGNQVDKVNLREAKVIN